MEFDLGRLLTEESKRMMNCLHEGIFIADKMGNIVFANQALLEMAGGTEEYALSLNVFDFKKQGVDVNKDQLLAQRALETKRRITRISEVKITTGYSYRQLGTATPLLDDEGEIQYIVVEMQTLDHIQRTYQDGLYEQREDFIEEVKKDSSPFICVNPNMKSILNMAKRIADMDTTILITGETGTGKQVLVDYIVSQSHLASKQVVSINCSSIPENLFESELFGYESGSFTGASKNGKMGLFEAAEDGVIFLDEINSMPLSMQGKLLRVLETKRYYRIGSSKERTLKRRFIAATNVDLKGCIATGTFRSDLYYRINIISLNIPPLRERKEDIIPLTQQFLRSFSEKYGVIKMATPELMKILLSYDWPGNVRELRNILEKLVIMTDPKNIYLSEMIESVGFPIKEVPADFVLPIEDLTYYEKLYQAYPEQFSLKNCLENFESSLIKSVLDHTHNTYKAAEILKVDQSSISRKINKYHISYNKRMK